MKSKDHISNSSLQDSISSNIENLKRLYVVTGKGGVGKTTYALALCHHIKYTLKKEVLYNYFDQGDSSQIVKDLELDEFKLAPESSLESYISSKLKSKTIASWILKTPFFSSLYQMIPGLGHMIMLGHIINKLKNNPELIIVLDSPSSGHSLTMFESSHNFKEIFGGGLLFKDIEEMHKFIYAQNSIKTFVLSLGTEMAVNEGLEVQSFLKEMNLKDHSFIINDSYSESLKSISDEEKKGLPEFLKEKIKIERNIISSAEKDTEFIIPHVIKRDPLKIILEISDYIKGVKL